MDDRVEDLDQRLRDMVEDIELPIPVLPEVQLADRTLHAVILSSDWSFAEASQALKARKGYLGGDDEEGGDE